MRETDREIRLVLKADSVKVMRYRLRYFIFYIKSETLGWNRADRSACPHPEQTKPFVRGVFNLKNIFYRTKGNKKMYTVTFEGQSPKQFAEPLSVYDAAAELGIISREVLAAKVNGEVVDLSGIGEDDVPVYNNVEDASRAAEAEEELADYDGEDDEDFDELDDFSDEELDDEFSFDADDKDFDADEE